MKYHIEDNIWKQIYNFLKTCKGIHTNHEGNVRNFKKLFGIWRVEVANGVFYRLIMTVATPSINVLDVGVKGKYGKGFLSIAKIIQI